MTRALASLTLVFFIFLGACSTQPVVIGDVDAKDLTWSLTGKLGVSAGRERGNYSIDWQQSADEFEITLMGPLGMGAARLNTVADGVVLNLPGEEPIYASDPNALLAATMGLDFPVSQVKYWVRGNPAPGRHRKTDDGFMQFGWTVRYLGYEQGLPVRIRLTRPHVKVTMAIKQWHN